MTWISRGVLVLAAVLLGVACARVPPHVSLPDVELGDPSLYPTLQAYAGAPIVGGNAVTLLLNGEQIFPAIIEAIRGARTSIVYAQYLPAPECPAGFGPRPGGAELALVGPGGDVHHAVARPGVAATLHPHHQPLLRAG